MNTELLDELSCDELVTLLAETQDQIRDLRDYAADIESRIVALAEYDKWVVDRIGFVEIRNGSSRVKWDTDLLWSAAVKHARTNLSLNPETGEVQNTVDAVADTLRKLLGATPNFTRGGVTAVGLDADRFSSFGERGRPTVKIVRLP